MTSLVPNQRLPAWRRLRRQRDFERVYAAVNEHMADESFSVAALARALGTSESTLKRRLKPLVNLSPVALIRERRLERAAALLLGEAGTVGEVATQVGFGSPSYFSRCFRARYGVPPSAFGPSEEVEALEG